LHRCLRTISEINRLIVRVNDRDRLLPRPAGEISGRPWYELRDGAEGRIEDCPQVRALLMKTFEIGAPAQKVREVLDKG
jgi:hypothetical protein